MASGEWYLGGSPLSNLFAELGLIRVPNFVLSMLVLRYRWPVRIRDLRKAPGGQWQGWRAAAVGVIGLVVVLTISLSSSRLLGEGIACELPG